jgi:hypothetical protein
MSSIIPAFFLSQMVALIDFDEVKMQEFGQEWLSVLQLIGTSSQFKHTAASPLAPVMNLSLTAVSELLQKNDLNISACAKDILCKPFLCNQTEISHRKLAETINDWHALVIDTYTHIKRDSKPHQAEKQKQEPYPFATNPFERGDNFDRYMTMSGNLGGNQTQVQMSSNVSSNLRT